MKIRELRTTFSAGEVDPLVVDRSDLKQYYQGLERGRNITLLSPGGARRRPGSIMRQDLTVLTAPRLGAYNFSVGQRYVLVFFAGGVDVYSTSGAALTSVGGAPWTAAMVPLMTWSQVGDTMIITHQDMVPQVFKRTGAVTFTLTPFAVEVLAGGVEKNAFYKFAPDSMTITPSGTTGAITVTTSAPYWVPAHGASGLLQIRIGALHVRLNSYASSTVMNAGVFATLPGVAATTDWDEQVLGNPVWGLGFNAVQFHEDRLWFAGHKTRRSGVYGSRIGGYFDFEPGSNDADPIASGLQTDQVNEVYHLLSHNHLLVLCDAGEFYVPTSNNKPITPTTIVIKKQGVAGTLQSVRPAVFDQAGLYAQASGNAMRDLIYSDVEQGYNSENVSLLSTHLIRRPVALDILPGTDRRPEHYAYCVNADGTIAVFNSLKSERITGWTLWETQGLWKSLCAIDGKVFVLCERIINGATKRFLEELNPDRTLDCEPAVVALAAPAGGFRVASGIGHLAGQSVDVVQPYTDPAGFKVPMEHVGRFLVSLGGTVTTIPDYYTEVRAGLFFAPTIKPLPVEMQLQGGTIVGMPKRLHRVDTVVRDSGPFTLGGREVLFRDVDDDFSLPPVLLNGLFREHVLGLSTLAQPEISQRAPLPLTVTAITSHVRV